MLNILFAFLFIMFSITTFSYSTRMSGINRTMYSINYALLTSWIEMKEEDDDVKMYFNPITVENSSIKYFSYNLERYVDTFSLGFFYFNSETKLEENITPDSVRISLKSDLPLGFKYSKAMVYTIFNTDE